MSASGDTGNPNPQPFGQKTKQALANFWEDGSFRDDTSLRSDDRYALDAAPTFGLLNTSLAAFQKMAGWYMKLRPQDQNNLFDPEQTAADWFNALARTSKLELGTLVRGNANALGPLPLDIQQALDAAGPEAHDWFTGLPAEMQDRVLEALRGRLGWFAAHPKPARVALTDNTGAILTELSGRETPMRSEKRTGAFALLILSLIYPYVISFLLSDWVFLIGSGSAIPRSLFVVILSVRFPWISSALFLDIWDDRLWFNDAPALPQTAIAVMTKLSLQISAGVTAGVVVTGLFLLFTVSFFSDVRGWAVAKRIANSPAVLSAAHQQQALAFGDALDDHRRTLIVLRERTANGRYVTPVSVLMRRKIEIISQKITVIRSIIGTYAHPAPAAILALPGPSRATAPETAPAAAQTEKRPLYTKRSKIAYPIIVICLTGLQAWLIHDQALALWSLIGKQIWVVIKQAKIVTDPYAAPSVIAEKTASTFIGNIPTFFCLMIPHRVTNGKFLLSWQNKVWVAVVLTITKTFLSNHFVPAIFFVCNVIGWGCLRLYASCTGKNRQSREAGELSLHQHGEPAAGAQATGASREGATRRKTHWMARVMD
ncbi:hypothetical protein GGE45_003941 [Rhizobium aethiopicum]|nr:hypothetical protein [Rhizobium aethiopicum]